MRENRLSGSEGGGPNSIGSPYPYVRLKACLAREVKVLFRYTLSGL
jgi:hypothetical protein